MKITLFPILEGDNINKIDSEPKAAIFWENGCVRIQTADKDLEAQLLQFYSKPLTVPRSVSRKDGIIGLKEVELQPDTEEFFRESVYSIRMLNYFGKLEGERKTQVVALDFDGTLWNSVHECFVMTCEAYKKLGWQLPNVVNLEEKFKRGRFFAQTGQDFYLLLKWIGEHPDKDPATLSSDDEMVLRKSGGQKILFEKTFYAMRQEWREKRFKEWCALQEPYPGIVEQLQKIQDNFARVVVATTKDTASVKQLLGLHGISLDVIGKETTVDKAKQMRILSSTYMIPLNEIIFVDDLLEQVRLAKSIGVRTALAVWGYDNALHKEEAEKLKIPVLQLETFAEKLITLF